VRSQRRARGHPNSGMAQGNGVQLAAVGATQGCNKAVGRVGRRRELAEGVLTEAAAAMAANGVLARELW
jgi:hypothetical protein